MIKTIPFNQLRLWWPSFGMGIPITSYGYPGDRRGTVIAGGTGYQFYAQKEYDCWVAPDGLKIPLDGCTLLVTVDGKLTEQYQNFSFTQLLDGHVQVNIKTGKDDCSYTVMMCNPTNLSIAGECFEDDD